MSYLTWLDYYISGARENLTKQISLEAEKHLVPNWKKRAIASTDREAMFLMSLAGMQSCLQKMQRHENQYDGGDADIAQHTLHSMLASLTCPKPEEFSTIVEGFSLPPPRAIKLSAELARDLSQAKAPNTEDWIADAVSATWYMDIPHRTLLVGPHQIRAILLQGTPGHGRAVAAVLILTYPGENEIAGRFAWMLLGGTDDQMYGCADISIDYGAVRESASDFVKLVLLYHRQIEQEPPIWLPTVSADFSKLPRKKQRARQKTRSMFAVRELRPPANRFGRTETVGSWRLDHRVRVRGHFRWQPHGPKSALRRLQFIAEHYRGPDEGEEKVGIIKL
jgi:hypothetical protein